NKRYHYLVTRVDLKLQIITRSSTSEIMTTPFSPAREFFIRSTTRSTASAFTTVATTFLLVYASSDVPLPLPEATFAYLFPLPLYRI
ncbi:MAG: hypothetical protein ACRD8Z_26440, partial [Nitrososphaeraceae archaeon]